MDTLTDAAKQAVARWTDPARRPLFKTSLIDWETYQGGGGAGGVGGVGGAGGVGYRLLRPG